MAESLSRVEQPTEPRAVGFEAMLIRAERERDELRREKGEAEALLGEIGAGGSPAGLVGATHNLIGMYEKAEARLRVMEQWPEYVCGHDHRWRSEQKPTRCPNCGTSTFSAALGSVGVGDKG